MQYDIVIIGGGPAGLTAGLYGSWSRMRTLLLEKDITGGLINITERVENYPGFPEGINGAELAQNIESQAKRFGLEIQNDEIARIAKTGDIFEVMTQSGNTISAGSVIIATGARIKKLGIDGEEKFIGRGVSYCATCDGPFFKNKEIAVIGGGNAAIEEAIFLSRFVKKINIVHRKSMLRAVQSLQDALKNTGKVEYHLESEVMEILGENTVKGIKIKNSRTNEEKVLISEGVFIFIGIEPNTESFRGMINLDKSGFIETAEDMSTSMPGVYACGDVRAKTLRQVVTATGDGAIAAFSAEHYVQKVRGIIYK